MSTSLIIIISLLTIATIASSAIIGHQYPKKSYSVSGAKYIEPNEREKTVIRNDHMGNYVYGFETSDGTIQRQAGDANGSKRGYYSYIGTDGKTYTVCYIADERGYRLVGDPMLGAIKEIQCPFDTDKRRPVPFFNKEKNPIRRNGYGYDKSVRQVQKAYLPPLPATDPFLPPYY